MKSFLTSLFLFCIFLAPCLHAQIGNGGNYNGSSGYSPQSPEAKLLDSVYRYDWETHNSAWILTQKQYKIKNPQGKLANDETLNYDSLTSSWIVTRKILYQYFAGSDSASLITGQLLNTQADTFATYLYSHYAKPGLPDESFLKLWDQGSHQFTGGSRTLTTYNTNDSVTEVIQQVLNVSGQDWVNASRDTYTHDASGILTQRLLESWAPSFSTWVNNYRWTFTHDSYNNLTGILEETWLLQNSAWMNATRTDIYVKGNGIVDSLRKDLWSAGPQLWIPQNRSAFIYSIEGLPYQRLDQDFIVSSQSWQNSYLTLYTYFVPATLIKTITGEFWKTTTLSWVKNSIYRNDSVGHEVEFYEKYWDPSTFNITGGYRNAWEFDASGNMTRYLSQNWDNGIANWANNFQDLYTYDAESRLMEDLNQIWTPSIDDWTNSRKYVYFYNEFIGVNEIQKEQACFHGNPLHAGGTVTCPSFTGGKTYVLSLYSLAGTLVYQAVFTGGNAVQIGQGLPEGMYLISVRTGGTEVYRDKVVVVR